MIASFVAYVQLFNSFCAAKMESTWNQSINNIYVYEYKKNKRSKNNICKMNPDFKIIAKKIGQSVGLTATPYEYFIDFFEGILTDTTNGNINICVYKAIKLKFNSIFQNITDNNQKEIGNYIFLESNLFNDILEITLKLIKKATKLLQSYDLFLNNNNNNNKSTMVTRKKTNMQDSIDFIESHKTKINECVEYIKQLSDTLLNRFDSVFTCFNDLIRNNGNSQLLNLAFLKRETKIIKDELIKIYDMNGSLYSDLLNHENVEEISSSIPNLNLSEINNIDIDDLLLIDNIQFEEMFYDNIETSNDIEKMFNRFIEFERIEFTKEFNIEISFDWDIAHKIIINYLDADDNSIEYHFQKVMDLIERISDTKKYIFLYIVNNISLYHYRDHKFIKKVELIIKKIHATHKIAVDDKIILQIFSENKRCLWYLIQEKLISKDEKFEEEIINNEKFTNLNYNKYFFPSKIQGETQEKIQENIETGENENYICQLIRDDSIEEFSNFFKSTNCSVNDCIPPSIYETNLLLLEYENVSLIDYAAFFGSLKIFNFLEKNKSCIGDLTHIFAIHSNNVELIKFFDDKIMENAKQCLLYACKFQSYKIIKYIGTLIEKQLKIF